MKNLTVKRHFDWPKVLLYLHLHLIGLGCGVYYMLFHAKSATTVFALIIISIASLGVTIGAHRLWCHRTYEASWPIRLFFMLAHTLAGVGPIYDWVLKHRLHHKYYGTEKDLYDHSKGFLHCHLLTNCMNDDAFIEKYKKDIDMRDIDIDGFIWIQKRFYWPLLLIVGLLLPINAPAEYWDEAISTSFVMLGFMRLAFTSHLCWLINSAYLLWGLEPGKKKIADDNSIFFLNKSYWLNYHYIFPWDWKSGEFGDYNKGFSTFCIKTFRDLGLITLLKSPSTEIVQEILYKLATNNNLTLNEAIEELKKKVEEEAQINSLYYNH